MKIDGQDRDVYLIDKGKGFKVVKMGELEGDKWQVAQVGKPDKLHEPWPISSLEADLHPVPALEELPRCARVSCRRSMTTG